MANPTELLTRGWQLQQTGQAAAAEQLYRAALEAVPGYAAAWCYLGMACYDQRRYEEAVQMYRRAIALQADFPVAYNNLGNALWAQRKLSEAVSCFKHALQLQPDYGCAYGNLAGVLIEQKCWDAAITCCRQALERDSRNVEAWHKLAAALTKAGRTAEACEYFVRVLELAPNHVEASTNYGAALLRLGRFEEAIARLQQTLHIAPAHAEAHKALGMIWLLQGQWERGWPEYEWRWRCTDGSGPAFPQPQWDGTPLAGRTILLHSEQGLGDTIQFVRFAPLVRQRGGRVIVRCQKALVALLATCPGIDQLLPENSPLPAFETHAPLLTLPSILRLTEATIPAKVPYLAADEDRTAYWQRALTGLRAVKIGIAWQGNPGHETDHLRSIPLRHFAPLAELADVQLINLQKGCGAEQLSAVPFRDRVLDLGPRLDETSAPFLDTAAVMKNLDLVISADTSIAHLAGALGVPVWVALAVAPDWRWLLDRADTPWYPTMRLFRQAAPGEWGDVFQRMSAAVVNRK